MNTLVKTLIYLSALLVGALTSAQVAESTDMYKALKKNDSLIFDSAFNKCKTSDMIPIIAEDLEFYHDTGGITEGKDEFFKTVKQNICGNPDVRPYRELVKGTLKVYPLAKNGTLYGAIQKGEHNFYLKEKGNIRPTVSAKFTHLWILENNKWMLKRVLSYDHQPIQN